MGCWGITAFESDAGLDAVCCIRRSLPKDGKLELDAVIQPSCGCVGGDIPYKPHGTG